MLILAFTMRVPMRLLTRAGVVAVEDSPVGTGSVRWDVRRLDLRTLLQAARAQWSWSHTSSILVGAAIAFKDGFLSPVLLFLCWLGVEMIHAGTCLTNDYWDYFSGADDVDGYTIFNAGSRVIQEGRISPRSVLALSFVCYGTGGAIGIGLAVARGWPILALGFAGGLLGYFYTAPPFKLCYRGMDQLALAICYGPLAILGSYYVQARRFSLESIYVAIVYGITASMILYVKGFQDTESDRLANKESVVIKLGKARAAALFLVFFAVAYAIIALGISLGTLPLWMLGAVVSIPIVFAANSALRQHLADGTVKSFFRLLLRTKSVHLYLGILLIGGYAVAGFLRTR